MKKVIRNIIGGVLLGISSLYPSNYVLNAEENSKLVKIVENPANGDSTDKNHDGKEIFNLFLCNNRIDFDEDGVHSYPYEFIGIKDELRINEPSLLIFISRPTDKKRIEYSLEIYDSNENEVYESSCYLTTKRPQAITRDIVNYLGHVKGIGNYTAIAKLDGKFVAKKEFKINPHNSRKIQGKKNDFNVEGFQIVLANYLRDFGSDGRINYPADYVGVKNEFKINERLLLAGRAKMPDQIGKKLSL